MKASLDWLDHRTGYRKLVHEALFENVPGGARWRYAWGSTLIFCFTVQVVTGLFLWLAYSPGSQTAWESVYYIQHGMTGGWFLRGLHHFTAQAMTVLLLLHLLQVVVDGAYKAPREVNYWTGVLLLVLVLALSLTGYLLPWDQKGYWATKVATNIAAITPLIGPALQKLVVGGADYGHHTLTRFFALHAGVIPGAIIAFIGLHVYLFRKHGLTAKEPRRRRDEPFWPRQVLCDAVACLAVLAVVLTLVVMNHGAPLGAPADPSEQFSAARPEWYFLFLFQFLKYFPGGTEVWGAIVIPTVLLLLVSALPILGRWNFGHRFNLGFLGAMLAGIAYVEDRKADFDAEVAKVLALAPKYGDVYRVAGELAAGFGGPGGGVPPIYVNGARAVDIRDADGPTAKSNLDRGVVSITVLVVVQVSARETGLLNNTSQYGLPLRDDVRNLVANFLNATGQMRVKRIQRALAFSAQLVLILKALQLCHQIWVCSSSVLFPLAESTAC